MATTPTSPAKPPVEKLDPKVVKTALILITGGMAVIFDTTIVSVALHTLAVKLDTSVATIQWVTTGYLLALAIAVPLSAWALQRFGGKRLWMFSLAVFLLGSIGSSLAWNVGSLIGWRVVQGIGGGLMLPLLATLIFQAAGGKALGRLVTYVALPALLGPILGPVIGGAILTHLSWRFMFWVNVPFCVAGLLLAWRYLADDAPGKAKGGAAAAKAKLDVPGLLLIAPGTSVLLYGLANAGTSAGFGRPDVIIPLVIGAALIAAFTWYALRKARPLVEIRLFAKRSVASASAALFFSGFSLYGAMLLLPLFYQDVRGTSALTAGIMLVPQGIGMVLSRTVAGSNIDKFGPRLIVLIGCVIVAAATVPFAFAGPHTSSWLLALWMIIRGFGLGAVTMPLMVSSYVGLDKQQIAHSSVLTRTAQQIGGSFGTAVLAVILEGAIAAHHGALADAFHVAFWWSAGFSAVAVLLSLWLPGAQRTPPAEAAPGAQPALVANADLGGLAFVNPPLHRLYLRRRPGAVAWHLPAPQGTDDGVGMLCDVGVVEQVKGLEHRVAVLLAEQRLDVPRVAQRVAFPGCWHVASSSSHAVTVSGWRLQPSAGAGTEPGFPVEGVGAGPYAGWGLAGDRGVVGHLRGEDAFAARLLGQLRQHGLHAPGGKRAGERQDAGAFGGGASAGDETGQPG
jgi:EmrB/QacA subfamily drug resistance transporter